jgi:hypothetical protein
MANTLKIKRSNTTASVPVLVDGEIAINQRDGKLFYRNHLGVVQEFSLTRTHLHPPTPISTNTIAVNLNQYILTASLTLTLPATPTSGDRIVVSNLSGTLTSVIARNGELIMGLAEDLTLDKLNAGFEMVYTGATKGWIII